VYSLSVFRGKGREEFWKKEDFGRRKIPFEEVF
jgi:hypothetical protein